jgi:hypothetical protein
MRSRKKGKKLHLVSGEQGRQLFVSAPQWSTGKYQRGWPHIRQDRLFVWDSRKPWLCYFILCCTHKMFGLTTSPINTNIPRRLVRMAILSRDPSIYGYSARRLRVWRVVVSMDCLERICANSWDGMGKDVIPLISNGYPDNMWDPHVSEIWDWTIMCFVVWSCEIWHIFVFLET